MKEVFLLLEGWGQTWTEGDDGGQASDFFLPITLLHPPDFRIAENEPTRSLSLRSVAMLALLPFLCSACCQHAQPRFWKVRDGSGGATAYTVDTVAVPSSSLQPRDIRYVDGSGKYVDVRKPKVISRMSETEWKQATSGAGYALWYCGHCMACWAKTKGR